MIVLVSLAPLIVLAVLFAFAIALLASSVRVLREYQRGVVFRLGRLLGDPKGPGLFLLIPIIDRMVQVDLRTITLVVPPQEVITRDNVPVRVNAVAYFRVVSPTAAIVEVADFGNATSQISQTTLRSVLGQHTLDELLSERDKINQILQQIIDEQTAPWGIKVSVVEVQGRRDPVRHAAGDGPPGRGRARTAGEGDRGRGRVPGIREAGGRRGGDRRASDRAPAALPADADRDLEHEQRDDGAPDPDRPAARAHARGQAGEE